MSVKIPAPARRPDLPRLAAEIAVAHGLDEAPSLRHPYLFDDAEPPDGDIEVLAEGLDAAKVAAVVAAHGAAPARAPVEPLTDDEITRLRALLATQ